MSTESPYRFSHIPTLLSGPGFEWAKQSPDMDFLDTRYFLSIEKGVRSCHGMCCFENRNTISLLRLKFPSCLADGESEVMMEDCDGWVSDIVLHILSSGIQLLDRVFSRGRDVMAVHPLFSSSFFPYFLLGCGTKCAFEGRSGTRF